MPSYVTHLISTGNPRGRYYYPAHLTNEKTEDLSSPGSWWGINRLAAGIITNIIIIKGRFAFESFLFGRPICHYGPTQGSSQAQKMDTISLKKKKNLTWKKKSTAQRKPQTTFPSQVKITLVLSTLWNYLYTVLFDSVDNKKDKRKLIPLTCL